MCDKIINVYFIISAVFLLMLSACGSQPPVPVNKYYHFPEPVVDAKEAINRSIKSVLVRRPIVNGIYNERAILNSQLSKPLEINRYHYHLWVQSPSLTVQDSLVKYLSMSNVAEVVDRKNRIKDSVIIDSRILRFEQIKSNVESYALVRLAFTVNKAGKFAIYEYEGKVKAKSLSMHSLVVAFGHAMDKVTAQLVNVLNKK